MKKFDELSECVEDMGNVLSKHLMEAQSKAADLMWEDVYSNANRDTGAYALSIYKGPTEMVNGDIQTFIGSEMQVVDSKGKSYNLGWLLEHGTDPHSIEPVRSKYLRFKINDKVIYTTHVNHPGTPAYNTYHNAKFNNTEEYRVLLFEALKAAFEEGFK